jgi:hypothetical protein
MDRHSVPVSAFDCDVLRSAFKKSVIEEKFPKIDGENTPRF